MSDRTDAPYKPPLSAILFDLRSVIGLLFVVYGIVLVGLTIPLQIALIPLFVSFLRAPTQKLEAI